MNAQAAYDELIQHVKNAGRLDACMALAEWDELTNMPPGGVQSRSELLAYLAGQSHEQHTHPRLGELLRIVEDSHLQTDPRIPQAVNVRELRRSFDRLTKLPRSLVEEQARITPLAQQQWAVSRQEDDFSSFSPWLEKIVALKKAEAECQGCGQEPYDALLEDYEPGLRSADLETMFQRLGQELGTLLQNIKSSRKRPKKAILRRYYPIDAQRAFAQEVAVAIGFDFERGRLDTSVHPFSTRIAAGDCRITVRYHTHQFAEAFFALLHEVGHGLYEQGLDPDHDGTPMGAPNSLGVHESQSRLWENCVGRGTAFWKYFFPHARQAFPEALGKASPAEFVFAIHAVEPSLNRIQADEVTYNLHILIRFELERALLRGQLQVSDIPAAWKDAYQRHLGVTPTGDADGCLQDGHWSEGLFGYFPTYTLGNLFAAQLFAAAKRDIEGLEASFARGQFGDLLDWLRSRVHRQGSRYLPGELIHSATGSAPDHRPLVEALTKKYGELYGL